VRVPNAVAPVLRKFAALRVARQDALVASLSGDDRLLSISQLRQHVAEVLTTFSEEEISEFVGSLLSLASLAGSHNYEIERLAEDIANSDNLELTQNGTARLATALKRILGAPAVAGLARAFDVSQEHERVVHSQRILTDLRPVFADPATEPLGVVVTHMLRIEAVVDGRVVATTFALDSADLQQLRELLDRANAKESTLDGLMERASLPRFSVATEDDD